MKRHKQKSSRIKHMRMIGVACGVCFLAFFSFLSIRYPFYWWKIRTQGELYRNVTIHKNLLYAGDTYGNVYAIQKKTGKTTWIYTADHPVNSDVIAYKQLVLFSTEGGLIIALDSNTGERQWVFSSPQQQIFITAPHIYRDVLLISDAAGSLYGIRPSDGTLMWQFASEPITHLEQVPTHDGRLFWQSHFSVKQNTIFFASIDGTLYALNLRTGRQLWSFSTGAAITTYPEYLGSRVYVGNKQGDSFALNSKTGKIEWQTKSATSVSCLHPIYPLDEIAQLTQINSIHWILDILHDSIPWRPSILQVTTDGTISRLHEASQQPLWTNTQKRESPFCPQKIFSSLFVTSKDMLESLDFTSGQQHWTMPAQTSFAAIPAIIYKFLGWNPLRPTELLIKTPILISVDTSGTIMALNGKSGQVLWRNTCLGSIFGTPITLGNATIFSCTDGGIYAVTTQTGNFVLPKQPIKLSQISQKVGKHQVTEITITHNENIYTNPYEDVSIEAIFQHENGMYVNIYGFYYDTNTWKVRFNAPLKGRWNWTIRFITPNNMLTQTGTLESITDTTTTYPKIVATAPQRLTLDGETIFNGIGIGDALLDSNANGNPLDDFATGDDQQFITTSSGITRTYSNNTIVPIDAYAKTYGPDGGEFNIFRWSINNASFNLWDTFSFQSNFLISNAKRGDTLVQTFTQQGYHVWLTLFGFDIPFSDTQRVSEIAAIKRYVRYVIARYGAYVSIWEIANEAYADSSLVNMIAEEIASLDHERRPIGMSWDHPALASLSIVTPHWYDTEPVNQTDIRVLSQIQKYSNFGKPILFGEVGNTTANWDTTSALRLRVRSWVSYFSGAVLVFWNQSANKAYYNPTIHNANVFIGPEERSFVRHLQEFTRNIHLTAKSLSLPTTNTSVRSYGLQSEKEILGYFYHYDDPYRQTSLNTTLWLPQSGYLIWYDPTSGKTLLAQAITAGRQVLHSPIFTSDIALKIQFHQR